ncbi:hypothetical protein SAMN05216167_1644 [Spirosoma endophyticum]|uniref:Uncharacterized protein n=2 Tax=Spirosoma endophyticum TaxID=662367 RepID=A0A1I2ICS6_9BACT|nr:hypothetical protein SAMN05216167_1644 [Spirosoma endophyticum]
MPTPDPKSFNEKLRNFCIFVLMILSAVADHYGWSDLVFGAEKTKWLLELIGLLL